MAFEVKTISAHCVPQVSKVLETILLTISEYDSGKGAGYATSEELEINEMCTLTLYSALPLSPTVTT